MRITYDELSKLIARLTPEQRQMDVTVEDDNTGECFAAELRIVSKDHDSLDEDHPVIYFGHNVDN